MDALKDRFFVTAGARYNVYLVSEVGGFRVEIVSDSTTMSAEPPTAGSFKYKIGEFKVDNNFGIK